MAKNSFIFMVSEETYELHRKYGFCATGASGKPINSAADVLSGDIPADHYGMISNIFNVKEGDIIFFYVGGKGFKGIYEAKQSPFFDKTPIDGQLENRPFRIKIYCLHHFDQAVPENALFSTPERQRIFWLWYHNKIRRSGRGCTPLDPDATNTLIELMISYNNGQESPRDYIQKEYPIANAQELKNLRVNYNKKWQRIDSEHALEALMMSSFREQSANIAQIFGDFTNLEWFADQIPYHISGRTMDMMLYHRSKAFIGVDARYQASVIELKKDIATIEHLHQLFEYCEWAGNQLFSGDSHLVQPALVAYGFEDALIDYLKSEQEYRTAFKPLKLIEYRYNHEQGLRLRQIQDQGILNEKKLKQIRKKYLYEPHNDIPEIMAEAL